MNQTQRFSFWLIEEFLHIAFVASHPLLAEVAITCDFEYAGHFSRVYRAKFRFTPAAAEQQDRLTPSSVADLNSAPRSFQRIGKRVAHCTVAGGFLCLSAFWFGPSA